MIASGEKDGGTETIEGPVTIGSLAGRGANEYPTTTTGNAPGLDLAVNEPTFTPLL